jgi:ATP-dependent helicase/nuclease subunit A
MQNFVESDLIKDIAKARTYREYEFVYRNNEKEKHGFIDLLVEYDDHFDIIDYKLKNIDDEHYDEQLRGYREYISSVSDKPVNCYLYSIMDNTWREVK